MNRRMILHTAGKTALIEAVLLILPLIVSLIYKEKSAVAFIITIGIALILGALASIVAKPRTNTIYAKEGFIIVTLAWITLSVIGCLPFIISGAIPNFFDAIFETVSGFTTTGSSILRNVEALPKGLLFWRSFTHWVGGMGILVFVMAILPNVSDRSIHIMRAEVPGPVVGKLVPKVKDTAKILYLIYIGITLTEIVLLICGGMGIFDSFIHSFGTAGTGGFGIRTDSIASYNPYSQWVITIFMLLFGLNFNYFYLFLMKKFKPVLKSAELWTYLGIFATASALITINIYPSLNNLSLAIRQSCFQVASIVTTTGYATTDFNLWPTFSKGIIFILLFLGGCAGSTAGGLKMSRIVLMFKALKRELQKALHPRSAKAVLFEGKRVEEGVLNSLGIYFILYMACIGIIFLILCLEREFDILSNLTATITCINNVGPGFGAVGPASNFADYNWFSKIILSFAMLMGRLEFYPIILTFSLSAWKK